MFIWQASYVSSHFSFDAYGVTEDEAREALIDTMARHGLQYGCEPAWWYPDDISVRMLETGTGYRDCEEIID